MKSRHYQRRLRLRARNRRRRIQRHRRRMRRHRWRGTSPSSNNCVPFNIRRKFQCPGAGRFVNMIRGRRHRLRKDDAIVSKENAVVAESSSRAERGCSSVLSLMTSVTNIISGQRHHRRKDDDIVSKENSVVAESSSRAERGRSSVLRPMTFVTNIIRSMVRPKGLLAMMMLSFFMLQAAAADTMQVRPAKDDDWDYNDYVQAVAVTFYVLLVVIGVKMVNQGGASNANGVGEEHGGLYGGVDEEHGGLYGDMENPTMQGMGKDDAVIEESLNREFRCVACKPVRKFTTSGATAVDSLYEVKCSKCEAEIYRCRHCPHSMNSLDKEDNIQRIRSRKSYQTLMKRHTNSCRGKRHVKSCQENEVQTQAEDGDRFMGGYDGNSMCQDCDESTMFDDGDNTGGDDGGNTTCQDCDESSMYSYHGRTDNGPELVGVFEEDDDATEAMDTSEDNEVGLGEISDDSDDSDEDSVDDDIGELKALLQAHLRAATTGEEDNANDYVEMFQELDLDANDSECCQYHDPEPIPFDGYDKDQPYTFDDFFMYDFRVEDEKKKGKQENGKKHVCQNQLYFFQKYNRKLDAATKNDAGGFECLVGRSQEGNRDNDEAKASPEETGLAYRLFDLVVQMKGSLSEKLCKFNESWYNFYEVANEYRETNAKVPRNVNDLKRYFTSGENSILKNFPAPRVYEMANHACVNLKEVFLINAAHGAMYSFFRGLGQQNEEGLNGTLAMDALVKEVNKRMETAGVDETRRKQTKIGYLLFWSDSFLNSFIKQKDNSVWVLTVTICPPENMKSSGRYTYILAISKSDADHSEVINHYMDEADKLMKGFDCYFGHSNKIERVALGMLCWSADRPEQQSITHTRKEGHYGRVTGWAVNVSEDFLPACKSCYTALIESMIGKKEGDLQDVSPCNNCCNWSFTTQPKNKRTRENEQIDLQCSDKTKKEYPKNYPMDAPEQMPEGRTAGMDFLPPIKLNNAWVMQTIRCGYYGVRLGGWKLATIREYLKTCNIKQKTADEVYDQATEDRNAAGETVEQEQLISDAKKAVPAFFEKVNCWESFRFPNLPMHGLGHGMIPDVMEIVHSVFKKYGKMTEFIKFANNTLTDVASLRLDFCKTKILPKAAWVGENSMAFMRLMPYLYGMYLLNNRLGKSEEARMTAVYLKCFVNSFQVYVSLLMSKQRVEPKVLVVHMKLFMSAAHYLHKYHGNLNKKKSNEAGPGKKSRLGMKPPKFTETQSAATLQKIAQKLEIGGVSQSTDKKKLISKLKQLSVNTLKKRISKLSEQEREKATELTLTGKEKKEDLIRLVHNFFLVGENDQDGADEGPEEWNGIDKAESMCWVRGNWLSFMANMVDQVSYLGQLHLIWEGRNEQQIGHVKDVLVSMRRTQTYRETKMRLLHKLAGIEWLRDAFDDDEQEPRDWFKGYFQYEKLEKITDRVAQGLPISCAASKDNKNHFYVAFCSGTQDSLNYVTLISNPTSQFVEVMGVQFCKFKLAHEDQTSTDLVKTVKKSDFKNLVSDYALMLPYIKKGEVFRENFTLVYHDWDVLECSDVTPSRKGHPVPTAGVFTEEYKDHLVTT